MLTANDIKNITFSNAIGGYKRDEVDAFLDKVEADYERTESELALKEARIKELEKQLAENEQAKGSINNVLISAQELAEKIVSDAKLKSAEIVAAAQRSVDEIADKGKKITDEIDTRAQEKKSRLEDEIAEMLRKAEEKKASIEKATAATVRRQQELYNAMRAEIAAFKSDITDKYKEHLLLLSKMKTSTEIDPERAAKIVLEEQSDEISSNSNVQPVPAEEPENADNTEAAPEIDEPEKGEE